jgi:CheY-like chemotaxis protein
VRYGGGGEQLAWAVDALEGELELVVKDLGSFLGRPPGVNGATIDGDGGVLLLLDVRELALTQLASGQPFQMPTSGPRGSAVDALPAVSANKRARVLVVEDSPEYAQLVGGALRNEGFAVDLVEDGAAALDLATLLRPDGPRLRRGGALVIGGLLAAIVLVVVSGAGIRSHVWGESIRIAVRHPLGVGMGRSGALLDLAIPGSLQFQHAHNTWLNWLVEAGWIGFLAVLAITGLACWRAWRSAREGSRIAAACGAGLLGIGMMSLADHPANSLRIALAMAFVIGLLMSSPLSDTSIRAGLPAALADLGRRPRATALADRLAAPTPWRPVAEQHDVRPGVVEQPVVDPPVVDPFALDPYALDPQAFDPYVVEEPDSEWFAASPADPVGARGIPDERWAPRPADVWAPQRAYPAPRGQTGAYEDH